MAFHQGRGNSDKYAASRKPQAASRKPQAASRKPQAASRKPEILTSPNWENRTLWTGDNLDIMRGMNSESVDLIYADPPFNSNRTYSAPIGSEAAGAAFKDTWTLSDVDDAWHGEIADQNPALYAIINAAGLAHGKSMKSYLIMMAVRLLEMRRLLNSTGSLYLHCDPTASHYLKMLMDTVFDKANYLNEVSWKRTVPKNDYVQGAVNWPRMRDVILHYRRNDGQTKFVQQFRPLSPENADKQYSKIEKETGRRYQLTSLTAPGAGTRGHPSYDLLGVTRFWRYSKSKMDVLMAQGRIIQTGPGKVPRYKRYLDESKGVAIGDSWDDIPAVQGQSKERVGYPTQKPLALLKRIIAASSNEGDMVMDPFCGCATACVAAEDLGRQWIGIDLSSKAADLVKVRLKREVMWTGDIHHRWQAPTRTDMGKLPDYRTHKHILYGRQEGICGGCQVLFPFRNFTIDHKYPRSRGGNDHIDNLWLLCGACNSMKGTLPVEAFIAKLKEQGLRA